MWFSAQGVGRDGVTNMDVVKSLVAEAGCVMVRGLREMVGSVVVVAEGSAVAVGVADVVRRWVVVDVYDEEDDSGEAERVLVRDNVQARARSDMLAAHGYPPKDERAHNEPLT